jgi:hypothetical protein
MVEIDRRSLISLPLLAAAQAVLGSVTASFAAGERVSCFFGQSGSFQSGVVSLGMLATTAPDAYANEASAIRQRLGHRRVLRASSTDKYGAMFCAAFVDEIMRRSDICFAGSVVTIAAWPRDGRSRDEILKSYHQETLALSPIEVAGDVDIHIVQRGGARTGALAAALAESTDGSRNVQVRSMRESDLVQIAGYLSKALLPSGATVRQQFREGISQKLQVADLNDPSLRTGTRFRIQEIEL